MTAGTTRQPRPRRLGQQVFNERLSCCSAGITWWVRRRRGQSQSIFAAVTLASLSDDWLRSAGPPPIDSPPAVTTFISCPPFVSLHRQRTLRTACIAPVKLPKPFCRQRPEKRRQHLALIQRHLSHIIIRSVSFQWHKKLKRSRVNNSFTEILTSE